MFGPELMQAMRDFKRAWDPAWKMNPGKIVDPYPITSHLRVGPDYDPPQPETHFQYPDDRHAFSRAVLRCVGIGKCRDHGGQTMCPSYMVTREEKDSTRGRARLLWEMMNGDVLKDGWRSEAVKDALDLCLSCKGCKHDCPVNVDMATYKAEFLSHYYEGRVRPRYAYAFGFVHLWSRLVHAVPSLPALVNLVARSPLAPVAKFAAGMAQERKIPELAPVSFRKSFARRKKKHADKRVVLFPDTFNDYFHPEISHAAVDVLERAGFEVIVPAQDMCCGRPFYDYGFLDAARRYLRRVIDVLRPALEEGTPIVVLEPSCAAVFRDELVNMLPTDWGAKRLHDQVVSISEFLEKHAKDFELPAIGKKALVHGHCHQKALVGMKPDEKVLERMKIEASQPADGCCGMAGSFGFEPGEHYDVSVKCGERVLLPDVRAADEETIIVADGFSCQTQIEQETDRRALHIAEIVKLGLDGMMHQAGRPEQRAVMVRTNARRAAEKRALGALGAACAATLVASVAIARR